jgi:hypothetical protein
VQLSESDHAWVLSLADTSERESSSLECLDDLSDAYFRLTSDRFDNYRLPLAVARERIAPLERRVAASADANSVDHFIIRLNYGRCIDVALDQADYFEDLFSEAERTLGLFHDTTLDIASDLSTAYYAAGAHEQAIEMHTRVVAERQRQFDENITRDTLSDLVFSLRNFALSLPVGPRRFELYERAMALAHDETRTTSDGLMTVLELTRTEILLSENVSEMRLFLIDCFAKLRLWRRSIAEFEAGESAGDWQYVADRNKRNFEIARKNVRAVRLDLASGRLVECRVCGVCDAFPAKMSACGGCKPRRMLYYCSRDCAMKEWKAGHKKECLRLDKK